MVKVNKKVVVYLTEKEKEEERAEKYGCDGKCYTNKGCCGGVDTCEETRKMEFIASVLVIPFILFILFSIPALIIVLIWLI